MFFFYFLKINLKCFLLLFFIFRGSAQPAGTGGTTVTPTSPAPSTRKTSAASSMTVETSSSGCTCVSTSCCDGNEKLFAKKKNTFKQMRWDYRKRKTKTLNAESSNSPISQMCVGQSTITHTRSKHTPSPELPLMQTDGERAVKVMGFQELLPQKKEIRLKSPPSAMVRPPHFLASYIVLHTLSFPVWAVQSVPSVLQEIVLLKL